MLERARPYRDLSDLLAHAGNAYDRAWFHTPHFSLGPLRLPLKSMNMLRHGYAIDG